ncbi:Deoxyguanosinetriphosphate triphospho hydrolase subgroup 1 [Salmonella enterica subsp. enterica]|nr:Deoxyguanosinetriphosphate triphospho hydrolase subgroup 1 [Salmonella enterica subsp. enterica]
MISGLLDIYQPLLSLSLNDFRELVEKERLKRFPIESRLFQKLSTRHRLAYVEVVSKLPTDSAEYPGTGNIIIAVG